MKLGFWCLLLSAEPLPAAETPLLRPAPAVDLVQWLAGLGLVLAAVLVFALLLRRFSGMTPLPQGSFRVLAAVSLGARERAVLLQAGGKQLVLGVAPGRVETLCVLEGNDLVPTAAAGDLGPSFGALLRERLGGKT